MRNDIVAECYEVSGETVVLLQCEQPPEQALSSSTPTLEEEEMKIIDEVDNDNDTAEEAQKQQKKRQWKRNSNGRRVCSNSHLCSSYRIIAKAVNSL